MEDIYVYRSDGTIVGFVRNSNLFSQVGHFLGWLEGDVIWDAQGQFRGKLFKSEETDSFYVRKYMFELPPFPQPPRIYSDILPQDLPRIQSSIKPIHLAIGYKDGF